MCAVVRGELDGFGLADERVGSLEHAEAIRLRVWRRANTRLTLETDTV